MEREWFEDFFYGAALELWRKAIPPDVTRAEAAFLEKALALKPGARLLDVPCGQGRIAVELAACGHQGTGVDISSEAIEEARRNGGTWEWLCADMRHLPQLEAHDAAYCWGNSFGYLNHAGTRAFFAAVAASLKAGARFALETGTAAECLLPAFKPRDWFRVDDILMLAERHYQAAESMMEIDYTFVRAGESETRRAYQRVYTAAEIGRLLQETGFVALDHFGSIHGEPFKLGSPHLILIAEKV